MREALKCLYTDDNEWSAIIDATNLIGKSIEMKFIVIDDDPSVPVIWEARMNRVLYVPFIESKEEGVKSKEEGVKRKEEGVESKE